MACVRRLAGDGVYWDRLRVSGRVRGATCAAPRKNRPTSLRGAFPSSRAANLTTTRDAPPSAGPPPQPLDGRAAAPRRAPPGTGTGSPMALFLRCWTATRPRGRRPRSLPSGYTLGPLRTRSVWCWRLWWWFLGVLNSRMCETISSCASGVKTLARLGRGFRDLLWQLKWLPLAYRKRLCSSASTYAQLHAAAQHLFKTIGADAAAKLPPTPRGMGWRRRVHSLSHASSSCAR